MRLDKFLKVSRLIKRRTVANEACEAQKVEVNGKVAKPGHPVKEGDVITVTFGQNVHRVKVKAVVQNVAKADASSLYEILE